MFVSYALIEGRRPMKNKTLIIFLAILCALVILEAGYLIGIGEPRIRCVYLAPRFKYVAPMPIRQTSKSFFVAATTSRETDEDTVITINLPGLEKEDIKIEVKGRYLTVLASQKKEASAANKNFYLEELSAANFMQRITLADNVKPEEIRAEFSNENLTITIPKDKKAGRSSGKTINIPIR